VKIRRLREERSLYTNNDIDAMSDSENILTYGDKKRLTDEISFQLMDAGHIPGSASVLLEIDNTKIFIQVI